MTILKPYKVKTEVKSYTYDPSNFYAPPVVTTTTTYADDPKEYSHTFTNYDFDPSNPDFQPAEGHNPSTQNSETSDYVDILINSHQELYIQREIPESDPPAYIWSISQITNITYDDPIQTVTDISPASFFEPPI